MIELDNKMVKNKKENHNYAFIDGANLHFGIKAQNWQVDYKKFRLYLKNKYGVSKAFIFLGWVRYNQRLYNYLKNAGFDLVFKPTVSYLKSGSLKHKGNIDAELVLYAAAREYSNYAKAVIVTSDGDFACLIQFLLEKGKLEKIVTPHKRYSSLLGKYRNQIVLIERIKKKIIR